MPQSSTNEGVIYHFVAIWLMDPSDSTARQQIAEQAEAWRTYPGVSKVAYGDALPGERAVVQEYDYGVLIVFENETALRTYEADPEHQQAIQDVLVPVAAKMTVYDFRALGGTFGGIDRSQLRDRQFRRYQELSN